MRWRCWSFRKNKGTFFLAAQSVHCRLNGLFFICMDIQVDTSEGCQRRLQHRGRHWISCLFPSNKSFLFPERMWLIQLGTEDAEVRPFTGRLPGRIVGSLCLFIFELSLATVISGLIFVYEGYLSHVRASRRMQFVIGGHTKRGT